MFIFVEGFRDKPVLNVLNGSIFDVPLPLRANLLQDRGEVLIIPKVCLEPNG